MDADHDLFFPLSDAGLAPPAPDATTNVNHDNLTMPHVLPADDDMFLDPAFVSATDLSHDFDGIFFAATDPDLGQLDPVTGEAIDDGFLPDAADWNLPVGAHETAFAAAAAAAATSTPSCSARAGNTAIIDEFFVKNRAWRPPEPCVHCRRHRLQCLILQTTDANPNPITSCSSCVALYRDCSLAERGKRQASSFETSQPVIGHLHGVNEEAAGYSHHYTATTTTTTTTATGITAAALASLDEKEAQQQSSRPLEVVASKRPGTRAAKKTRPLSNWFARNLDHPYPSDDQKADLASQCGLSRTQVINWFANARRRHRLSAQSLFGNGTGCGGKSLLRHGSPMPRSLLDSMSPMERWRNSPPNNEPASASAIQRALNRSPPPPPPPRAGSSEYFGSYGSATRDAAGGSACSSGSGESGGTPHGRHRRRGRRRPSFYRASSSFGGSAHSSQQSAGDLLFVPYSANNSVDGDSNSVGKRSPIAAGGGGGGGAGRSVSKGRTTAATTTFQCTFCLQTFRKRYDWVRHERSIHLPGLDSWVCRVPLPPDQSFLVWRVSHEHPECIFCGEPSPTHDHIQSHEFQTCSERAAAERTFTRKDHLWQHLHKFHHCRKWEGWRPDLTLLQHKQDRLQSRCGFCSVTMNSWEERAQHLASHFRRGATMAEWSGRPGIRLPEEEEKAGGTGKG